MGRRVVFVLLAVLLVAAVPAFAVGGGAGAGDQNVGDPSVDKDKDWGKENPFGAPLKWFQNIVIGAALGALCGAKFVVSMMRAYVHRDENPYGMRNEMIKFFVVVSVGVAGYPLLSSIVSV